MCTTPTPSYGPLEAWLNVSEGVAFKSDDGGFLCPIDRNGLTFVEIVSEKTWAGQFLVENLGDGKVRLRDRRGFYLRRTCRGGKYPIEVRQMTPDASCEYQVFTRNGKVLFKGDNGLFLSRFFGGLYANTNTLEADKNPADQYCELILATGIIPRPIVSTSSTNLSVGLGQLEIFMDAAESISFKADDGGYLCPITRDGFTWIEIVKDKNSSCNFCVERLPGSNSKVRLIDSRGFYLKRNQISTGRNVIQVRQYAPDVHAEFQVYTRNGFVLFEADSGTFCSRYIGEDGLNKLEACKNPADMHCEFLPEMGHNAKPKVIPVPTCCYSVE